MSKKVLIIFVISVIFLILGGWFMFQDRYTKLDVFKWDSEAVKYPFSIAIDGIELNVDVARTEEEKARGLSGRTKLDNDEGMLFIYDRSDLYPFLINDMDFPVDVIWIGEDFKVIDIEYNVKPESSPQSFYPQKSIQYVVEVNAGWVENHKIHVGSPVVLNDLKIQDFATGDVKEIFEEDDSVDTPASYKDTISATNVLFDVPFTPQAAFGNWEDIRQSNACEEASVLMAMRWVEGRSLSLAQAKEEIIAMSDFEKNKYGHFHDTSAKDTVDRLFKDYFKYTGASVRYGIYIDDIKNELRLGNLVIIPADGRKLGNPYYTPPGPPVHMLVIRGYDDTTREFITNDPGTKRGEAYRYDYKVLENAIADYPSGYKEPSSRSQTAMIVVRPR